MSEVPHVYTAIADVMGELAKEGISKNRKNQQQNYQFRGIDDVYNALSPLLAKHKLTVLPRVLSREVTERETQKGGVLFYVVVRAEFDFISAVDGSKHTVGPMYGEAMDSGDKATNKAMSAAYKYAAMQAFCIPTEGDNDADGTTHEGVQPRRDLGPRPDTHGVDMATVEQYVSRIADIRASDRETPQKAELFLQINEELSPHADVFTVVYDEIARRGIITKQQWRNAIQMAMTARATQAGKAA